MPIAWVVLPDHFHVILDVGEESVSKIMHRFKITYSRRFRERVRAGRVWQNRFWDHAVRDQDDMNRHIDYIHYNPVHHNLVDDPFAYDLSSIQEWYQGGYYQRDWGTRERIDCEGEYGE